MKTQAYFEDIQYHIKNEINKAKSSIQIAVAWFTDAELFDLLCQKANEGKTVHLVLMNDKINNNSNINYELLNNANSKVWKVEDDSKDDTLMHNKFCIIDNNTIITGSYNWSCKAQKNYENITIIKDNPELVRQFSDEFHSIIKRYSGDTENIVINYKKIIIRLETIKNVVLLEDEQDIYYQLKKLKKLIPDKAENKQIILIKDIISLIEKQSYGDAVVKINDFVNKYKQIVIFIDPEISAFKLEIKALELQVSSLEDEKSEVEKLIHNFEIRHNKELDKIIINLLELRKEKLKTEAKHNKHDKSKQDEYKEAEKDYKEFQENHEVTKKEKIYELTEKEKQELKTNFRKASKLCHPDVVAEEHKKEAERIFNELKQAYDQNNLQKVNEILKNLEKGIFVSSAEKINEKEQLINIINHLHIIRKKLVKTINELKNSDVYKTISEITDWNKYFAETKEKLQKELNKLKDGKQ